MASDYLINTVKGYEDYIRRQGIDEQLLDSYKQAIYNMDAINTIVWQLKEEILSGEECLTKNVGEIDEK